MTNAVQHATGNNLRKAFLPIFFSNASRFKSNSKWDDEDRHHYHEAMNTILNLCLLPPERANQTKKTKSKVTLLRCVIGVPTASFASPALTSPPPRHPQPPPVGLLLLLPRVLLQPPVHAAGRDRRVRCNANSQTAREQRVRR
jgi:hypothetical protein